jgi:nitrite reductase (NADH) small subunit
MTALASTRHPVGDVDTFGEGRFQIFRIGSRSVGVVRVGETFYAVLNACPHALAPVCEGVLSGTMLPCPPGEEPTFALRGRILCCPWHHYEFDLGDNGRAVFTDYRARLRLFPVHIEDGKVFVEIKTRPPRSAGSETEVT